MAQFAQAVASQGPHAGVATGVFDQTTQRPRERGAGHQRRCRGARHRASVTGSRSSQNKAWYSWFGVGIAVGR